MTYLERRIEVCRAARNNFVSLARKYMAEGNLDAARFAAMNARDAQKLVRRYRGFGN